MWSIVGALIAVIVLVVAMSSIALAGMPSDQGVRDPKIDNRAIR